VLEFHVYLLGEVGNLIAELSVFHSETVTRNSSAWISRISRVYFFMYV